MITQAIYPAIGGLVLGRIRPLRSLAKNRVPPVEELDSGRFRCLIDFDEPVFLEVCEQSGDIGLGNMVYIRAAGILYFFRVAAEASLVIGVGPYQGKQGN